MKNHIVFALVAGMAGLGTVAALRCHSCVLYDNATSSNDACRAGPFDNGSLTNCDPINSMLLIGSYTATKAVGDFICITISGNDQENPTRAAVFRGCAVQEIAGEVNGTCILTSKTNFIAGFGTIAQGAKQHMCTVDACNTGNSTRDCIGEGGGGSGARGPGGRLWSLVVMVFLQLKNFMMSKF